jgi:uncharacterized protein
VVTFVYGDFEWDEIKAGRNLKDHGVPFEEAAEALATDPHEVAVEDPTDPARVVSLAMSPRTHVLFIVSTVAAARTRMISARKAESHEQRIYSKDRP